MVATTVSVMTRTYTRSVESSLSCKRKELACVYILTC